MNKNQLFSIQIEISIYKELFNSFLTYLNNSRIEYSVMFGAMWANEIYDNDWEYRKYSKEALIKEIGKFHEQGYGEFGEDDIYIKLEHYDIEVLFCHEKDIHIIYIEETKKLEEVIRQFYNVEWKRK